VNGLQLATSHPPPVPTTSILEGKFNGVSNEGRPDSIPTGRGTSETRGQLANREPQYHWVIWLDGLPAVPPERTLDGNEACDDLVSRLARSVLDVER
jgi:hypothetical protein